MGKSNYTLVVTSSLGLERRLQLHEEGGSITEKRVSQHSIIARLMN